MFNIIKLILNVFIWGAVISLHANPTVEKLNLWTNGGFIQAKFPQEVIADLQEKTSHSSERIRFMSFNIFIDDRDDEETKPEKYKWLYRKKLVFQVIDEVNPDILAIQEPSKVQIEELKNYLKDRYVFVGKARGVGAQDIAEKSQEYNGFFIRKDRFKIISFEAIDVPESKIGNNLAMAYLLDQQTKKTFAVINCHMAFNGSEQYKEAILINEIVKDLEIPVIFATDTNIFPADADSHYPFFGNHTEKMLSKNLKNARENSLLGCLGPNSTFTSDVGGKDPFKGLGSPGVHFDRIYSKDVDVLMLATIPPQEIEGELYYYSDHMAIVADLNL